MNISPGINWCFLAFSKSNKNQGVEILALLFDGHLHMIEKRSSGIAYIDLTFKANEYVDTPYTERKRPLLDRQLTCIYFRNKL